MNKEPCFQRALGALEALREGNGRFTHGIRSADEATSAARLADLSRAQTPGVILVSCSDSRVPSELVFDCGLGELFVVRVAGNVCAPTVIGSVEFAAETFNTQLVVVMGHTGCGAVDATIRMLQSKEPCNLSENVRDIVERIAPAVDSLIGRGMSPADLLKAATRANVGHTVDQLRHGSRILESRIARGELIVVGAEYALQTGEVDFFDVPEALSVRTPPVAA